jgi:hypothetical protein
MINLRRFRLDVRLTSAPARFNPGKYGKIAVRDAIAAACAAVIPASIKNTAFSTPFRLFAPGSANTLRSAFFTA